MQLSRFWHYFGEFFGLSALTAGLRRLWKPRPVKSSPISRRGTFRAP